MDKFLACLAILIAKLVSNLIRLFGLGMASNLPGKVAQAIYPNILPYLAKQLTAGCLAITGTNGKSTTSGLLASILNQANYQVIHNRQGANLIPGITAAFVQAASWNGTLKNNFGLLEVDEAALPLLTKAINCQSIVVTNLYRDQLDRFGELDTTAKLITQGIKEKSSQAILNADDANVCNLLCPANKIFYGLNYKADKANSEISYCPKCGNEISYSANEIAPNVWHCPNCNYSRPQLDFFADQIQIFPDSSTFVINTQGKHITVNLSLPGVFNIYNATAAGAAASSLGINLETIKLGLEKYETLFGRSEKLSINSRTIIIQLIKNPAGASKSLVSLANSQCAKALIAINDNFADGRDVSWLWDANFEVLSDMNISFIVSGQRGQDMAVRLKYAGIPENKISCVPSLASAFSVALEQTQPNQTLWVLPTYTALLETQKIIKRYNQNKLPN
jgi:lipid II isoglutaminyl synthase (glutamine-hydrolysing)